MPSLLRVLIIEDSPDDAELVLRELRKGGYEIVSERVETAEAMRAALGRASWDVIICDYSLPHFSGLAALAELRRTGLDVPFILVSGTVGEDVAVEALRAGATITLEYRCGHKQGTWRILETTGVNLLADPAIQGIVLTSHDLTEKKALAEQFLRAQRLENLGQLAGGIAHDLNNVLAPILMSLEILLCVNARDAMPTGGTLTLEAENVELDELTARFQPDAKPGPYVLVRVTDTGTGIPPAIIDRIFDPFFTTKGPEQGTGLGLSTVLGIVQSHGGFIQVESQPGHGAVFKVYLPAQPDQTESAAAPAAAVADGQGELVLLVEDEEAIRGITRKVLQKHGYQVLTAANGVEGVALYVEHRAQINLLLTDWVMPFMDGGAMIRSVRRLDPALKIILATGKGDLVNDSDTAGLKLQALLPKPYTADRLLAAVRAALAT